MCGIAGFVTVDASAAPAGARRVLERMTRSLRHRGPDDEGFHVEPGCWLGHRRLSIIDLDSGHQPLYGPDGNVCAVLNGEIYNYVELRDELVAAGHAFSTRTDTEVLVHGWRHWGSRGLLERLDGMFALALWDARTRRLVLARDRLAKKPLYVAVRPHGLAFASELKALFEHPWVQRCVDARALRRYLFYGFVPTPHAIAPGVRKLTGGAFLEWRAGDELVEERFWQPSFIPTLEGTLDETAAQWWSLFRRAVQLRLRSDVPLGVFLSGGIDSTAVVAAMAELTDAASIHTFSIAFEDRTFDESSHARTVARHFGTRHRERTLRPDDLLAMLDGILLAADEPLADGSIVPTYLLSGFAREHVTVALGGDGGDELFLGYPTFVAHGLARAYRLLPDPIHRHVVLPLVDRLPVSTANLSLDYRARRFVRGRDYDPLTRHFAWIGALDLAAQRRLLRPAIREAAPDTDVTGDVRAIADTTPARDDYDLLSALYMRLYLGDGVLVKVDRASMAHALEVRAPFLDVDVVDYSLRLPRRFKLRAGRTKVLLRHVLRGRVPRSIVERPKKGFGMPIAAWLRGPLREWAERLLDAERIAAGGFFDPAEVQRLLQEHVAGKANHRTALWALLVFELWRERWGIAGYA